MKNIAAGGAGNVVLNLVSLGAAVTLVGRVGNDWAGHYISQSLQAEKVDIRSIVFQDSYKTPIKNRVIAENQQIVRIDHEQVAYLPEPFEQMIIESFPQLLENAQIVAISDYGKGLLTPHFINGP